MAALDKDELTKVIEVMYNEMAKKGMLPADADKKNIINNVVENLTKNNCSIDKNDLSMKGDKDNALNLRKALMVSIVSEAVSQITKDDKNKMDYTKLFKKDDEVNPEKTKQETKQELNKMFNLLNMKLTPENRKSKEDLDKMSENLSEDLTKKFMNSSREETLSQNKETVDVFAELTCSLCALYGGIDPREAGGLQRSVDSVMGNFAGLINFNPGGGGLSFMSDQNTADPGKADPTGREAITLTNALSLGGMTDEVEKGLTSDGLIQPSSPRPAGPGQGGSGGPSPAG